MELESPVLVIVFGYPGTGKTTLAAALSSALGIHHLNTDILRSELHKRDQYGERDKREVYAHLLRRTKALLKQGKGAVLDGTFSKRAYREALEELARKQGVAVRWIRARASEEAVRDRVSASRPHSQADFGVYEKIRTEFELPFPECLEVWTDRGKPKDFLPAMLQYLKA